MILLMRKIVISNMHLNLPAERKGKSDHNRWEDGSDPVHLSVCDPVVGHLFGLQRCLR